MTSRWLLLLAPLVLTGCPSTPSEPPPPPSKSEIAVAPPRALGALAAGTDAAPKPDTTPPTLGDDDATPTPPAPPAVAAPDAGAAPPAPAAPSAPDAGMAL